MPLSSASINWAGSDCVYIYSDLYSFCACARSLRSINKCFWCYQVISVIFLFLFHFLNFKTTNECYLNYYFFSLKIFSFQNTIILQTKKKNAWRFREWPYYVRNRKRGLYIVWWGLYNRCIVAHMILPELQDMHNCMS